MFMKIYFRKGRRGSSVFFLNDLKPLFVIFVQWVKKVEKGQEDFDRISKAIRKEVARFDKYRVEDFKDSVVVYLEQLMENQKRVGCAINQLIYIEYAQKKVGYTIDQLIYICYILLCHATTCTLYTCFNVYKFLVPGSGRDLRLRSWFCFYLPVMADWLLL